jgi:hypothetical protein
VLTIVLMARPVQPVVPTMSDGLNDICDNHPCVVKNTLFYIITIKMRAFNHNNQKLLNCIYCCTLSSASQQLGHLNKTNIEKTPTTMNFRT